MPARRFLFDTALARGPGRLGRSPSDRRHRGAADQLEKAVERVLPVARLRAVALRDDDQNAVAGEPRTGEPLQPRAYVARQRRRMPHVEAGAQRLKSY